LVPRAVFLRALWVPFWPFAVKITNWQKLLALKSISQQASSITWFPQ